MRKILLFTLIFCFKITIADMPNTLDKPIATRFFLSQTSTQKNQTAFHCTVKLISQEKPPCDKSGKKCQLVQVAMFNHGQNITGFANNNTDQLKSLPHGRLMLTAKQLNSHYFTAYHDTKKGYNEQSGYVDIIVAWPNAKVYCAPGVGYIEPLQINSKNSTKKRSLISGDIG